MGGDHARLSAHDLVDRYMDELYRYACRWTGSPLEAEDLVQETFLIAARKVDQLRDPNRAFAWLVKILRGCRSRELRRRLPMADVPVEQLQAVEPGKPAEMGDIDPDRVVAILDSMPDEFRGPLLLFYFEELRYRDIADILAMPLGTVMSRIARAKAYLRERLTPVETNLQKGKLRT